jgi:hypothetical protein
VPVAADPAGTDTAPGQDVSTVTTILSSPRYTRAPGVEPCGRRMESAWSDGKPACRCRHGHTTAAARDPGRPKNVYIGRYLLAAELRPPLATSASLGTRPVPAVGRQPRAGSGSLNLGPAGVCRLLPRPARPGP